MKSLNFIKFNKKMSLKISQSYKRINDMAKESQKNNQDGLDYTRTFCEKSLFPLKSFHLWFCGQGKILKK